jgi:hypothetical protein
MYQSGVPLKFGFRAAIPTVFGRLRIAVWSAPYAPCYMERNAGAKL